jgi:sarcosine oxidase subunit delta
VLAIECPWCGKRDEEEFSFGGPWNKPRPVNPELLSDEEWADYLYIRDNERGVALERWRHTFGCRQWFVCERHSVTHEITAIYKNDEVPSTQSPSTIGDGPSVLEKRVEV